MWIDSVARLTFKNKYHEKKFLLKRWAVIQLCKIIEWFGWEMSVYSNRKFIIDSDRIDLYSKEAQDAFDAGFKVATDRMRNGKTYKN